MAIAPAISAVSILVLPLVFAIIPFLALPMLSCVIIEIMKSDVPIAPISVM